MGKFSRRREHHIRCGIPKLAPAPVAADDGARNCKMPAEQVGRSGGITFAKRGANARGGNCINIVAQRGNDGDRKSWRAPSPTRNSGVPRRALPNWKS